MTLFSQVHHDLEYRGCDGERFRGQFSKNPIVPYSETQKKDMISSAARKLTELLICPRSREKLELVSTGNEEAFLCSATGVLYPIVDDVVIMQPITKEIKERCEQFLKKNGSSLSTLGKPFDIVKTRQALALEEKSSDASWEEDEMAYWESFFGHQIETSDLRRNNWNRTLPRKRLLDGMPISLPEKTILEIGCGGATTLFDLYGNSLSGYIGLDLSFHACKLAQKQFPNGLFIQGSVDSLPFGDRSIDLLVAFGVLHHLPRHEEHLMSILPVLKEQGYFVGSDPILKPRLFPWRKRGKKASKSMREDHESGPKIGASPHNEWINWENMLNLIRGREKLCDARFEYGPLRAILVKWLYDGLGFRSKIVAKAMIALDHLWLATIGKLHRSIGPAGVIYVIQRNKIEDS